MTTIEAAPEIDAQALSALYENESVESVIQWAMETFGNRVAICTSFQAEGMVILDKACRIDPNVRVFTIDTGRMPDETYELIDRVRDHYGIPIEVYYPDNNELSELVSTHGISPFYKSVSLRMLCCEIRKVNPLNKVLSDLDAWVTGIRRTHTSQRASVGKIEKDEAHGGITKVNPLANWSSREVWDYIRTNNIPYNNLYDQGYTSIGCAPCTRPTQPGEDPRAGRWWWEDGAPKECGIHLSPAFLGHKA